MSRRRAAAILAIGAALGWLIARPTWEVRLNRTLGLYASGQPSFIADGHRARITNDGYLRIEAVRR